MVSMVVGLPADIFVGGRSHVLSPISVRAVVDKSEARTEWELFFVGLCFAADANLVERIMPSFRGVAAFS